MLSGYFHRVREETPTRFWINNPSEADMDRAIAAGAIDCTTNPAYCSKLLKSDPDYIRGAIDDVIKKTDDDEVAAVWVYQEAAVRVMARFLPLYEQSSGSYGYVTMQDDPRKDEDTDAIIQAALGNRSLGKNFMAKIPVIEAGLEALEACVEEDIPICATEVFSIDQTIHMCDLYQRAANKTGKHPPFYITHITGIFDDYMGRVAKRDGIEIDPAVLAQAGCAVARKEYGLLKERGYPATMLGGGARGTHHFTEMVGGDVHITINWSTAEEIIEANGPVVSRIGIETPQPIIDELADKFIDFRKAFYENSLSVGEFADYGPVQLFRNSFLQGYYLLLAEICARRALHPKK